MRTAPQGFVLLSETESSEGIPRSRSVPTRGQTAKVMGVCGISCREASAIPPHLMPPEARPAMEISDIGEFLNYFNKVHQRTMNVVRAIPPDKVDWRFREEKFTLGDLVRHIATANRYIFVEVCQGKPSAYNGCGRDLAASYDEIIQFSERLHGEDVEILSGSTRDDLTRKCTTPDGSAITTWKWLRAMIEHEAHHRGQIYTYLALLEKPSPPLYGLTSEQVRKLSVHAYENSGDADC
jgi:uncharacterized damage-inducible protein DinB